MTIDKYRIHGTDASASKSLFEDHMRLAESNSWREFRSSEMAKPVAYAAEYLIDAVQTILHDIMRSDEKIDVALPSGWRARSLDVGHHWKRHVEFLHPSEPGCGFVLEGVLARSKTADPQEKHASGRSEIISRVLGALRDDTPSRVLENNEITDMYDPANSTGFGEINFYPYTPTPSRFDSRRSLIKSIKTGRYAHAVVSHFPSSRIDTKDFPRGLARDLSMVMVRADRATSPAETMSILPVLAEFLGHAAPDRLRAALEAERNVVHYTVHQDDWLILAATRAILGAYDGQGVYPPEPFAEMMNDLWKRTVCLDVLKFLPEATEVSSELLRLGYVSDETGFECNDGRTNVYVVSSGDASKIYVDQDAGAICLSLDGSRVVVSEADYRSGTEGNVLVDITTEDGKLVSVNGVSPYGDALSSSINRAMIDISSAHCHLLADRQRKPRRIRPSAP